MAHPESTLVEATGVLLVGGLSRRFGSVKALAPLGGNAGRAGLADPRRSVPRAACRRQGADQLWLPFPLLDDGIPVRAPIAGVVAGLRATPTEVAVFLPVDCPLVTPDALRALADACADAAVPETAPLPGAYARTALPVLEQRLRDGRLALDEALATSTRAPCSWSPASSPASTPSATSIACAHSPAASSGGIGGTSLVAGVRWSFRGKDAGSADSKQLKQESVTSLDAFSSSSGCVSTL